MSRVAHSESGLPMVCGSSHKEKHLTFAYNCVSNVSFTHREHTILLSRDRVNTGTKEWAHEILLGKLLLILQILQNTVALSSYLGLSALRQVLQRYAGFVSSSFRSKISWAERWQHEKKGTLFNLFVPLVTLSLLSKIVCSLWFA